VVHKFFEPLPRLVREGEGGHACPECATRLEPWEGQPKPRLYGFSAREVALTLTWVATGTSYRDASARIRTRAGRELDTAPTHQRQPGKAYPVAPNRHGQLASDWTETFARVLWEAYAPAEWPATVLLDEDELRYARAGRPRGVKAFYVLGAMGYDRLNRPYVAALEAVPRTGLAAWSMFLASLPGAPSWVVSDRGWPRNAAMTWWSTATPTPDFRVCEWHLARNLDKALPTSLAKDDPFRDRVRAGFRDATAWGALRDELQAAGYGNAMTYWHGIDAPVRAQMATRVPGRPNSTGPLEEFFHQLDRTIGDRAARMTNKSRADALLKLLAMARNGWVDEIRWAELIRDYLATRAGLAPDQRRHTDSRRHPSLR
jgi:hypothetical protein